MRSSFVWRAIPVVAFIVATLAFLVGTYRGQAPAFTVIPAVEFMVLIAAVFASVHHADVIAHRTGEPYGTLVLTVAVTVIEVALILSVMLTSDGSPTLARDTVFAVLMVVCNGLVGLCLIVGGFRYGEQGFRVPGVSSYLVVLIPLATLTLVLPGLTTTVPGPFYSTAQVAFISLATLILYGVFLYVQTVRHRDYFLSDSGGARSGRPNYVPEPREFWESVLHLLLALTAVVLLAKTFGDATKSLVRSLDAPIAAVGLLVAILVLLPESLASLRSARRNELQKSLNLALGSSLATIGLTVPAVGTLSLIIDSPIALGLDGRDSVLLALTLVISIVTFGAGRTNILPGFVHIVLFGTFVFLLFTP
jgi:Ca2+:H+ antiporter